VSVVIGKPIGRYLILEELARGGMGEVYLAVQEGLANFSKLLVVKTLRPSLARDPLFINMFMDEARLTAQLNHPNIAQTNEVGVHEGIYFIAMEFLEGQPLQRLRTSFKGATSQALRAVEVTVVSDTLLGLHYAHESRDVDGRPMNVVHRDATPHNIFITYEGQVKVVDFGIAKMSHASHETATGTIKGKLAYMAPEQAEGISGIDRRADVFSLGVVLWEALAGRRMWDVGNDIAILGSLHQKLIPSIRDFAKDVPEELLAVVDRAVAHDRERRFPTALAFHEALEAAVELHPQFRAGPKAVARLMAQQLDWHRIKLRSQIEDKIMRLRSGRLGTTGASRLELDPSAMSGSQPGMMLMQSGQSLAHPQPGGAMQLAPSAPPAGFAPSGSFVSDSSASYGNGMSPPTAAPPPGPARSGWVWAVAVAVVAVSAVAAVVFLRVNARRAAQVPVVASSDTAALVAPVTSVTITTEAEPASAVITVDGVRLLGNPVRKAFPKTAEKHRVRIEAAGYQPSDSEVVFDADASFKVTLTPLAAPSSGPQKADADLARRTQPQTAGNAGNTGNAGNAGNTSNGGNTAGPAGSGKRPTRTIDSQYPPQ
jgi:serine/threonine-protein kinase